MQSIEKASGEEDDDDQNKDFNKIVEELGEEVSRIDQLKRQYQEREEKKLKIRKRLHQEIEKKHKEMMDETAEFKRQKVEGMGGMNAQPGQERRGGSYFDVSPNKSLNNSFQGQVFPSQIWNSNIMAMSYSNFLLDPHKDQSQIHAAGGG